MKQQHLLFLALGILVVYSLVFPQKELNQNPLSNDDIKIEKETDNEHQLTSFKIDMINSRSTQTESYIFTNFKRTSKLFILPASNNLNFPPIDFRMNPLQI